MLRPLLVVLALSVAGPAVAQKRLAVLDVSTPPFMMGLGNQVLQTVLSSAQEQGYKVTPPDEVRIAVGDKTYEDVLRCEGRPGCVTGKLSSLKVDRIVVGSLNRDEKSYLLKLELLDLKKGTVVSSVDRAVLIAARRLAQDVTEAVPPLLRGEREALGTLELTTNTRAAEVTINGENAGATPLTVKLKPGKHEVKLRKERYLTVSRWVTVEANQVTQDDVRMILQPGQVDDETAALPVENAEKKSDGPAFRVPTSAWIALGAGAAAAAAGVGFGVSAQRAERQLRDGYDSARNLYAGTRDQAVMGKQHAMLANVFYVAAGVGVATAVVLTVLKSSDGGPSVSASIDPTGAGLSVRGDF
ncbi:MAG: PEGA domain-containing protein [Myxococcaceae bacterium]